MLTRDALPTGTDEPAEAADVAASDGIAPLPFRFDVHGLRAVAVVAVVLCNLGLGVHGGYVGVDVFFVISGFVITRQLSNEYAGTGRIKFMSFYARRAKRILPAATVEIVGTVLADRAWDAPGLVRTDALDGLFSAFGGLNWRLGSRGADYLTPGATPTAFQHFWSLAVEEQFYFVWPAFIIAIGWLLGRRLGQRRALISTLLVLIGVSLYLSGTTTTSSPSWAAFGSHTRVWELAVGALIATTTTSWSRLPSVLASLLSWVGLGAIVISCFEFSRTTTYPGWAVVVPVLGTAFIIASGCARSSASSALLLRLAPFQFVGTISYSWYLVHWPVLTVLPLALGHSLPRTDKYYVLAGSLALAIAMYYLVERPVRVRPLLLRQPALGLSLAGLMVLTSVIVALIVANGAIVGSDSAKSHVTKAAGSTKTVTTSAPSGPKPATAATLAAALSAGAKVKTLPGTTPSVSRAPVDRPKTGTCVVPIAVDALNSDAQCSFGDLTAPSTIVLVGDSHADQWQPAISAYGLANGYKVIEMAKSGCPAGVYPTYTAQLAPQTVGIYTTCNDFRTQLLAHLKVIKPKVIVVADYLHSATSNPAGMVTTVQNYESTGARVIYLEDTPSPEKVGSVPTCLTKNKVDIQKCSVTRASADTRLDGFAPRKAEATAVAAAGAIVIDPTDWFCTTKVCPTVVNKMIVYSDDSLITATYAQWLTPLLTPVLKNAIG